VLEISTGARADAAPVIVRSDSWKGRWAMSRVARLRGSCGIALALPLIVAGYGGSGRKQKSTTRARKRRRKKSGELRRAARHLILAAPSTLQGHHAFILS